jgi:hypothetical protein
MADVFGHTLEYFGVSLECFWSALDAFGCLWMTLDDIGVPYKRQEQSFSCCLQFFYKIRLVGRKVSFVQS